MEMQLEVLLNSRDSELQGGVAKQVLLSSVDREVLLSNLKKDMLLILPSQPRC